MKANKIIISMAVLLALIFCVSFYTTKTLTTTSKKLEGYITQIEEHSNQGNWSKAEQALSGMKHEWDGIEKTWTVLLDHIEIDNIDSTMERMEKFIQTRDKPLALAEAAVLKKYIVHIPDKEAFKLKNLF